MINHYLAKKAKGRVRLAATADPKKVELFETVIDEETQDPVERGRGFTSVKELNGDLNVLQAWKAELILKHQEALTKVNAQIDNLKAVKTDIIAMVGGELN